MKYKSVSIPLPSPGVECGGPVLTVPNQSLSLREILDRFTRNQAVPVGRQTSYDEGEEDLEKLQFLDPVDKAEFVEKMKEVQLKYSEQEKGKAKAEQERLYKAAVKKAEAAAKKAVEKAAKKAE